MGGPPTHDPRGTELSLAHLEGRRQGTLRLSDPVLELPSETGEGSSLLDAPGSARARDGTVPLEFEKAFPRRVDAVADLPGRRRDTRLLHFCLSSARQRGPLRPSGGNWTPDPGRTGRSDLRVAPLSRGRPSSGQAQS